VHAQRLRCRASVRYAEDVRHVGCTLGWQLAWVLGFGVRNCAVGVLEAGCED